MRSHPIHLHPIGKFVLPGLTLLSALLTGSVLGAELAAEEISRRASQVDKVQDWQAQAHIKIIYPDSTVRIREGEVANKLQDNHRDAMRLYRFDSPADISGTSLLIYENGAGDDDMWLYLPALSKSRRIVSSNRNDSFVGTEFAYVDLMTQQVADYQHRLVGREPCDGGECYVVDSIPKTPQQAKEDGYARQRAWIRTDNFVGVRIDYYDLQDRPFKTQRLSELTPAAPEQGKWIAARRHMKNLQSGRETVISFEDIVVNRGLSNRVFRPARLERR